MLAVLLFGLIAVAAAAPQHSLLSQPPKNSGDSSETVIKLDLKVINHIYHYRQTWLHMNNDVHLINELVPFMYKKLTETHPSAVYKAKIEDNEYRIDVSQIGDVDKDLVVKDGFFTVQANSTVTHDGKKTLDAKINASDVLTGTFIFEEGVLKVVFPLKAGTTSGIVAEMPKKE